MEASAGRAGAQQMSVVDPSARTVTVFRADGSARLVRQGEDLEGENVLPGLAVALSELFGDA